MKVYHWLCGEAISETRRDARFILLHLHNHGSRHRLFPDEPAPSEVLEDLTKRFDANPVLAQYGEKQRRVALRGERTPFIQDDVLAEIGVDPDEFRLLFRLLSQHTHNGRVSFYRMASRNVGTVIRSCLRSATGSIPWAIFRRTVKAASRASASDTDFNEHRILLHFTPHFAPHFVWDGAELSEMQRSEKASDFRAFLAILGGAAT